MNLDFSVVPRMTDLLLWGVAWTIVLSVLSMVLSLILGAVFAVVRVSSIRLLRWPVQGLSWVFMGTPLLLQLYVVYFGLAELGLNLNAFSAGVIALSLHFAVYNADIIRAGIQAIDSGQYQAARSLGVSHVQAMRKVVVPQAMANVAPALGNMMIALLKESALVSAIGVMELTLSAQRAISQTFRPFEFYLAAAALYYLLNLVLQQALRLIERRTTLTR
ncbi:MAG: polar amino acid transport system permease protein [Rhodobacteraceae bacterium HLUCCA12]|nr:MAG: polar amino acid transport system permease protein [Rhodobacteraceae bacterium HLUCCA12]